MPDNQPQQNKAIKFVKNNLILVGIVSLLVVGIITAIIVQSLAASNKKVADVNNSKGSSSSVFSSNSISSVSVSGVSSVPSSDSNLVSQAISSTPSATSQASSPTLNNSPASVAYTNPSFPDFKLVYSSDWKIDNSTASAEIDNLLKRTITLSKDNTKFVLHLGPSSPAGCNLSDAIDYSYTPLASLPNNFERDLLTAKPRSDVSLSGDDQKSIVLSESNEVNNLVVYSSLDIPTTMEKSKQDVANAFCHRLPIRTNIPNKSSTSSGPIEDFYGETVGYTLIIDGLQKNDPNISIIDQIVAQSSFK